MAKPNSVGVYLKEEEEDMVAKASKIIGLNLSSFFRYSAMKEAREILKHIQRNETDEISRPDPAN